MSYTFNEDALNEVLNALQVSALVRGRSNAMNGYVEEFRTKCYAIGTSTDPQNKGSSHYVVSSLKCQDPASWQQLAFRIPPNRH